MTFRVLPAAAFLLLSAALTQAHAADYYPHTSGTSWTYTSGETQLVGTAVTYKGVRVVPVNHQYGGKTFTQDLLEYRADGSVWLRGLNLSGKLLWYSTPLNVYPPGPLAPGQRWQSGNPTLGSAGRVTGSGAVRVPAGTYNALVIRTDLTVGGQTSSQTTYFVPGLGVVRYAPGNGSPVDLRALDLGK
ncbi:hypothetical protein [Deinococcus hopiensis]|uniref:Uncharacterized protein n=1 Tax=Deinococcus hopiensis KR-140 TaxID=695939 RepID=A0A1W1VEW1_9DEIO|nr:hypothetical protein [Deinococcus hopiensis]SMB91763.1 hypothetical protein SAMN00790413_01285 [Deinococcus hopiensis KR-140]